MSKQQSKRIKVENFKLTKNNETEINSALTILIIGIPILIIPFFNVGLFLSQVGTGQFYLLLLEEIFDIYILMGFLIVVTGPSFITFGVIGWALGGFVSSILYGKEGQNGPLYASFLLFRMILGILILFGTVMIANPQFGEYAVSGALLLILFLVSLPLILVSAITYRIGLWISPE